VIPQFILDRVPDCLTLRQWIETRCEVHFVHVAVQRHIPKDPAEFLGSLPRQRTEYEDRLYSELLRFLHKCKRADTDPYHSPTLTLACTCQPVAEAKCFLPEHVSLVCWVNRRVQEFEVKRLPDGQYAYDSHGKMELAESKRRRF
jgi:hypothetical protein